MVEITILFDFIAALAFAGAVGLGVLNWRDTDLERGFWVNFTFGAALGFFWTSSVLLEWLGVAPT